MTGVVQTASQASQAVAVAASYAAQTASQVAESSGVPPVVWSGLISGLVAALASYFVLRTSQRHALGMLERQQQHDTDKTLAQREHDDKQKDEDRKIATRREVYLGAIEKSHALLGAIGGYSQLPLNGADENGPLLAFLSANAKIWLVANPKAAHLSRQLAGQFAKLHLNALIASRPAREAVERLRLCVREVGFAQAELERLRQQFSDAHVREAKDFDVVRFQKPLDAQAFLIKTAIQRRNEAQAATGQPIFQAFGDIFGELRAVQRTLCVLVSLLREELNLPADADEFMEQLRTMEREAWTMMNEVAQKNPPEPMPDIAMPEMA